MLSADTVLNGRYRLLDVLGEGGMATVYRAQDMRLGRTVAVKILHQHYSRDEPFLQRFQQEAEFAASLGSHPNIVAIYDVGQDDALYYIVMEYVEGRNLKEVIRERAPLSVEEAFATGSQVASALDFAHKRGLVHRDVKPQNILVPREGTAKVTDFGIARSTSASQLTRTGMVIGTVHYFSPEQAQGKASGPASDIYSLGVILYEMLTAHLPFDAETPIGVAMMHVNNPPPSPWEYNDALPARAVATVMRALEKDPERRYRDAAEFAAALATSQGADMGATTLYRPVAGDLEAERTVRYVPPLEEVVPVERTSYVDAEEARPSRRTTAVPPPSNRRRSTVLALVALMALTAIATGAYYASHGGVFGGGKAPTPTLTATPRPTPHPVVVKHKATPTATIPARIVQQPTAVIYYPTFTPTPVPPTFTPVPIVPTAAPPTRTPKPTVAPTAVQPTPTLTPVPPAVPTASPTSIG